MVFDCGVLRDIELMRFGGKGLEVEDGG